MVINRESAKSICVSHIKDVDGIVCAALINLATNSNFLLTNYGNLKESLRSIGAYYDHVYLCDLGINSSALDELSRIRKFAEITYIDHHHIERSFLYRLEEIGVDIIHHQRDCASILTYNLFKELLPREAGVLASYAAISDRLEHGPLATKIVKKFDRDFILFESMLLSYALETADVSRKKGIVKNLSKIEHPHEIEGIPRLALEEVERIATLRKELPTTALKIGHITYVESQEGAQGRIANLLLDVCNATIGVCYKIDLKKKIADISLRGQSDLKIDLGKITSQVSKRLGGFGGGHPKASGARIPSATLMEFIYAINDHVKSENLIT